MHSPIVRTIRVELVGADVATAGGITVRARAPVLELCRRLVAAGYNPGLYLEAYRGETLCLCVATIGRAAGLTVDESSSCRFARFRPTRTPDSASPIRSPGRPLSHHARAAETNGRSRRAILQRWGAQ
jgi:hypothetical protein